MHYKIAHSWGSHSDRGILMWWRDGDGRRDGGRGVYRLEDRDVR